MRNFILIFVFLFALTGSYANNFSTDEFFNSSVEFVSSFDDIYDFDGFEIKSISVESIEGQCTVTIKADFHLEAISDPINLTISTTDCEDAIDEAIAGIESAYNKLKDL